MHVWILGHFRGWGELCNLDSWQWQSWSAGDIVSHALLRRTCLWVYHLFILSLGRVWCLLKVSWAPAAIQHVSLAALFIWELGGFLSSPVQMLCFGTCQQVWSGVKRQMAPKWHSCHRGWTSSSQDGTSRRLVQAALIKPTGTYALVTLADLFIN